MATNQDFKINEYSDLKNKLDKMKKEERFNMHAFHRYFGKLIPAIPAAAIEEYTHKGDVVLDPFAGSGTTLLEAKLRGRRGIGIEINPISHFITTVKTTEIDVGLLKKVNKVLIEAINQEAIAVQEEDKPFCINRDHWFKAFVQRDLIHIKKCIDSVFDHHPDRVKDTQTREKVLMFYRGVLSAIIRNVSNADPQHVFPGYSKRLRALDEVGKRRINVRKSFIRGLKKRTNYMMDFYNRDLGTVTLIEGDSRCHFKGLHKAQLIVTNPPYISSVRYIETMKLELYWMAFILSQEAYTVLEREMIGNDRVYKKESRHIKTTGYDFIDSLIEEIYEVDPKSAAVISHYFLDMEQVIENMNRMLVTGGKVVMKISDSHIRKKKVETGKLLTWIAENYGFKLVDCFMDKIENRSLTKARNTYSDIILHDYIITWEKTGDRDDL